MDLDTYRKELMQITRLEPKIEKLHLIGDLAVVTLDTYLEGTFDRQPIKGNFKYIRFWKFFPDGVKVVGGSGTALQR